MNIGNLSKHLVKYALLSRIRLGLNNAFFYVIFEKKILFVQILDIYVWILADIICPTSESHSGTPVLRGVYVS